MAALDKCELFDLNDQKVSEVALPPRADGAPPRNVIWKGRRFVEGGQPDSFYGAGQLAEVFKDDA